MAGADEDRSKNPKILATVDCLLFSVLIQIALYVTLCELPIFAATSKA